MGISQKSIEFFNEAGSWIELGLVKNSKHGWKGVEHVIFQTFTWHFR